MTDRQVEFHAFYHDLRIVDQKNFYSARSDEYRAAHRQAIIARNLDEAELDWSTTDPHADQTANVDRVEEILRKEASQWGQLVIEASSSDNGGKSPH
ncbi:MAG: hypothetical protein JO100_18980 [Pseudonocardia sp.]|nr:hypothetical protein [Pseudonocardia sp.]